MKPLSGKVDNQCYDDLENRIGYQFRDAALVQTALTHASYSGSDNYQRLEFLGDSVLGFIIAEYLYTKFPEMKEGDMTKLRSQIVREQALADLALKIGLDCAMIMGRGEIISEGFLKPSILADVYESVVGAIYLDGGMEAARSFVMRHAGNFIQNITKNKHIDYKSALQEFVQKTPGRRICYELLESEIVQSGTNFVSAVYIDGEFMGSGSGSTKKASEQAAAKAAYDKAVDCSSEDFDASER